MHTVIADAKIRRSLLFFLIATVAAVAAPRSAQADLTRSSIRCVGSYGDGCRQSRTCVGIGVKVCHETYAYYLGSY